MLNQDYHDILAALVRNDASSDLITNKLATGRAKDRVDAKALEGEI